MIQVHSKSILAADDHDHLFKKNQLHDSCCCAHQKVIDKSRRVASLPLDRITLTDPDVFFLVKNAPEGLLQALNQSTLMYVDSVRSQVVIMKSASLLLTVGSVLLLACVVLFVVRPPLSAVEQHKEGILEKMSHFLNMPACVAHMEMF